MKLSIFNRLSIGYASILVLVIAAYGYLLANVYHMKTISKEITAIHGGILRDGEQILHNLFALAGFQDKFFLSRDPDFFNHSLEAAQEVAQGFDQVEGLMDSPQKARMLEETRNLYGRFLEGFERLTSFSSQNEKDGETLETLLQEREETAEAIYRGLGEILRMTALERDERIRQSERLSARALTMGVILVGLILAVAGLISFFTTRSITGPVNRLQKQTRQLAHGKFEEITGIQSPPELSHLADEFNIMSTRLRALDELKAEFISHVSHELRTPLTAIKEASSMLIEGVYEDRPESRQELFSIIHEECKRLIGSVNQILDLSRMEAGLMPYRFEERSLVPVIQRTLSKLEPIALQKGIQLRQKDFPEMFVVVMDQERMGQVLENLVGNALKYTSSGGTVTVEALRPSDQPDRVQVSVKDTGDGIPQEHLETIFEKFRRADAGQGGPGGTGLGLVIARGIIEAHRGKIWVESQQGKGSAFHFTLPVS